MDQTVRSDDIAKIVEKWTGIPVGKLLEKEGKIYMHLEESLGEYVIGQNEAIQKYLMHFVDPKHDSQIQIDP